MSPADAVFSSGTYTFSSRAPCRLAVVGATPGCSGSMIITDSSGHVIFQRPTPAPTCTQSPLYSFTSPFTFTSCNMFFNTSGPTYAECLAAYNTNSSQWTQNPAYFNVTGSGVQHWTVPTSGAFPKTAYCSSCMMRHACLILVHV